MPFQCTEAEWKIMEILWDASPRSMPEITKLLAPATGWTRHTVITLLKRMQEKGTVSVDETGPVKMYTPLVSREAARSDQTHKLLNRVFSGNASLLMNTLVDSGEITVKEMEELVELLKQHGMLDKESAEKRRKKITERPVIWAFQKIKPPTFRSDGRVGGLSVSFHESRPIRRVCPASHTGRKKSPRTAKIQTEVFP